MVWGAKNPDGTRAISPARGGSQLTCQVKRPLEAREPGENHLATLQPGVDDSSRTAETWCEAMLETGPGLDELALLLPDSSGLFAAGPSRGQAWAEAHV